MSLRDVLKSFTLFPTMEDRYDRYKDLNNPWHWHREPAIDTVKLQEVIDNFEARIHALEEKLEEKKKRRRVK